MNKLQVLAIASLVCSSIVVSEQVMVAQEGWDPVKTAHIIGAANWCSANATNATEKQDEYTSIASGASRILDKFIEANKLTQVEADLVKNRVLDQGYYLGRSLNETECVSLSAAVANIQPWEVVTSSEGQFVVEMPSLPNREDSSNTIQGQNFDWIEYEVLIEPTANPLLEKSEYYLVAFTKLPQDYKSSKGVDEIFDAFGEYIFQEMGLPELKSNEKEITPDGVPARLTSGEGFGQSVATIMYIVEDRFYLNLVVSQKRDHFERFLRSFEVLDFPENTASSARQSSS